MSKLEIILALHLVLAFIVLVIPQMNLNKIRKIFKVKNTDIDTGG